MSFSGRRGGRCLLAAIILALATAGPALGAEQDAAEPGPAQGAEQDAAEPDTAQAGVAWGEVGAKTMDVLVLRPLGAIATVAGLGFFAVSSPIAAASQRIGMSWNVFVMAPADYTVQRPLGDF